MREGDESADNELLSLRQAEVRYLVRARTLASELSAGVIAGRKVRGAHGKEWRVFANDLEAAGYRPRQRDLEPGGEEGEMLGAVRALEHALAGARRELDAARLDLSRSSLEV